MKQLSTIILLIAAISCKEKSAYKLTTDIQETAEPKVTNTVTKTARHVQIPNSHLYIIPPAGFVENKTTMQLKKEYANFMLIKIYYGLTPEKFFNDLKVEADKNFPGSWKRDDITADGHQATIYHYKMPGVMQYYLAFTDGHSDEMIITSFEETDAATGKLMYEAMKTVVVKK